MKIYNTITRKKEEFKPIVPNRLGIYVCGPTVYGPPHIGHARSYIVFDTVIRWFRFNSYKVKYVQNITDVGHLTGDSDDGQDKILKQALLEKIDPYEIAYKYETQYFNCMDKLNVERPSISARATGFIPEMIDMVQDIINAGYGYVTKQGNVYYNVHKFKNYGQLSNRTLDKNLAGERIEVADDKINAEDFALWKKAEPEHIMKWNSPWGVGYPGWHLECSAMSRKFLGKTFDIHGGGIDNMFPHHECEFAQSEIANGQPFVNYFMHNNLITVNGTKMGKSLGNTTNISVLLEKYKPMALRYYLLQVHYRSPLDFTFDGLDLAQKQFEKMEETVLKLRETTNEFSALQAAELTEINNAFTNAMNEDFNTPVAISEILKLTKLVNREIENKNKEWLKQANTLYRMAEEVLGLKFEEGKKAEETFTPAEVETLAKKRLAAKQSKDFKTADELRAQVEALGYMIKDTKDGYEITKKQG